MARVSAGWLTLQRSAAFEVQGLDDRQDVSDLMDLHDSPFAR